MIHSDSCLNYYITHHVYDPAIPAQIVPNENICFHSHEEAYKFYCYYTKRAGHGVRIAKTHPKVGEFSCNKQGKWEFYKSGGRERNREDITEDMLQGFCEGEME
jgi:hypothetical protein